jgi:hypothetical protein
LQTRQTRSVKFEDTNTSEVDMFVIEFNADQFGELYEWLKYRRLSPTATSKVRSHEFAVVITSDGRGPAPAPDWFLKNSDSYSSYKDHLPWG